MKDCVFENGVQRCVRPGTGVVNYTALMCHVKQEKPEIIGLLEESAPQYFAADCAFFGKLWEQA